MKLIMISLHDRSSVSRSVLEAGANAFVTRRAIATDLLAATDAVLAGRRYVSLPRSRNTKGTRHEAPRPGTIGAGRDSTSDTPETSKFAQNQTPGAKDRVYIYFGAGIRE